MPRGGARPGAGRKPGSLTRRTREVAERAALDGITPLQVMLHAIRTHAGAGQWDRAAEIAHHAAPYMHPRLSAVQIDGSDGPAADDREAAAAIEAARVSVARMRELQQCLALGKPPETWPEHIQAMVDEASYADADDTVQMKA